MSLLDDLRELFHLDQQVRGMQKRLDAATRRHNAQQTKLSQLNQQSQEVADQLKQAKVKASTLENQTKEAEQRIEHLREQMQSVRSNKEYSAVLVELNTLKVDNGKVEDELLAQLGEIDRLNEQAEAFEARVADQQKLVNNAQAEIESCRAEIGHELDSVTAKRGEAEQRLPTEIREQFNRTAHVHEGEAMAVVIEENRRRMEYTCGGCYMAIPVERVNSLMTLKDQIIFCPNCSRILYIDQELKESIGSK